jgi:hypothetical protein
MAGKQQWQWRIKIDRTKCEYGFFVSHVSEDSADVKRFADALDKEFAAAGGLPVQTCFLDIHDWDLGNPATAVIRRKLAASQFFVGWVTPHYLDHARRGWAWFELAYAELIELNLQASPDKEFPFVVPIFRDVSVDELSRTPWLDYHSRIIERPDPGEALDSYLTRFVPGPGRSRIGHFRRMVSHIG